MSFPLLPNESPRVCVLAYILAERLAILLHKDCHSKKNLVGKFVWRSINATSECSVKDGSFQGTCVRACPPPTGKHSQGVLPPLLGAWLVRLPPLTFFLWVKMLA